MGYKVREAIVSMFQEDGGSRHQAMVMKSDVTGEVRLGLKGENTLREAPLWKVVPSNVQWEMPLIKNAENAETFTFVLD